MYLETAADLGVIGFIILLAIFAATMVHLERLRRYWSRRRQASANMVTAFLLSLISYMATAIFLHLSYLRYLALILALANAVIYITQSESPSTETPEGADTDGTKPARDLPVPAAQTLRPERASAMSWDQGSEKLSNIRTS